MVDIGVYELSYFSAIVGSEVHIDMFDDRIEIYSPGGMASGRRIKQRGAIKIPSKRRNPVLADVFSRLKYMERRGSGFQKIYEDYEKQENFSDNVKPIFDGEYDDFTLTLFNLNYCGTQGGTQDGTQGDTQDGTQGGTQDDTEEYTLNELNKKMVELITKNNKISTQEMAVELGICVRTVKRKIKEMPNVQYVGSGYSGHWEIK